jgi:hypothetical protein
MATLELKVQHIAQIDDALWATYGRKLGGTELKQLARLFSRSGFLERLGIILKSALPPAGKYYRVELEVSIAWIDKHPLARLRHRKRRVELGDAALFHFPILKNGPHTIYRSARAMLLQAKVAKVRNQLFAPCVPVNPPVPRKNSSTELELDLLSRWDTFDLFKAAGSGRPLAENLTLPPAGTPPPYAWFMATPRWTPDPEQSRAWKAPWMCGPAGNGAACNTSFGSLIARFLDPTRQRLPTTGWTDAGVDFEFDPAHITDPGLSGNDWARLCHELLNLAGTRQLPRYLCEDASTRPAAISGTTVRSFPYLGLGDPEHQDNHAPWPHWLAGLFGSAGWNIVRWLWPWRFPIVIVTSIELEGVSATATSPSP